MSSPYADAVVEARLEWGNLDAEFEARVRAATEKAAEAARKQLARIKLAAKVELTPDTKLFKSKTQAALSKMLLHANVTLRPDLKQLRERLAALKLHTTVEIRANVAKFNSDVRAAMARLSESKAAQIKVSLTITQTEFRRFAAELRTRLAEANIRVPVGLDLDEAGYRARLALLTRPVTQTVNINTTGGGSGAGGLGGLNRALDGTNSRGRTLRTAGIAGLIVAIGGAAGLAAGAVGALAAGIGAIGVAGIAGLSTVVVGMQGIGDAFSAFSDQTTSAGTDAKAQAKAVEAAAKQMESAEKGVVKANKNSLDAQKDLNSAREDATRSIEDVNFALKGTAIDEKDAALALARAREAYDKTFSDPTATGLDRAEASLGIDKALRRQDEVARRNNDLIAQAADANAKGVEGSDEVVAAKERVVDAEEQVVEANEAVVDASEAMQEALEGTNASADKVAEALAKLSPNARAFVLAMRDLGPLWTDLKTSVQDAMFADLDGVFTNLAKVSIPTLKTGMTDVAGAVNGAAKDFAAFWSSAEGQKGLENIFAGGADFITAMQPGLQQATQGFLAIADAARPVMGEIGASIGGLVGQIGQAFTDANASGALTQLMSTFADIMDGLGGGLNALLDGLIEFGNIVGPIIGPLLQTLGESLGALAPSLGALGVAFGDALIQILPTLSQFISDLADGLVPVMPVLAGLFGSLMTALTPLIGPLSDVLVIIGEALTEAIIQLAPAIEPLGLAFVSLVEAIAPFLPVVAKVISELVQALAPALTKIFDALGPVITQWLDGMMPVLDELAPIIADVALQLGQVLADALIQITPMLPTLIDSFSRIVLAIVPFIPQLIDIGITYAPKLIEVFMFLVQTVLPPLTSAIEFLATYVLPLVIEAIRVWAQFFGDKIVQVKDQFVAARDFFSDWTGKIAEFFGGLGDKVASIWGGIVSTIKGAVGQIGKFLQALPEISIPDLPGVPGRGTKIGFKNVGQSMVNWAASTPEMVKGTAVAAPGYAAGGLFRGAGGPTDDSNLIRISNKEHLAFVTRAAATNSDTIPFLDAINNGWVPPAGLLHAMVPGYKDGGVVDGLTSYVQNHFPELQMTSGLRSGDSGHHGSGTAADFSNGQGNTDEQLAFANHMASKYKSQIKELIYDDPRFDRQIKNGEFVDKSFYAAAGDHTNHVHVAMDSPPQLLGAEDMDMADPSATSDVDPNSKQGIANQIVAEGRRRGMSDKQIKAALMAGLAETDLQNLDYGMDGDNAGILQQRDNGGWGTLEDRKDPTRAVGMFYDKLAPLDQEGMTEGQLAQAVQQSGTADGSNYSVKAAEADELFAAATEPSASSSSSSSMAMSGDGGTQAVFVTNWPDSGSLPGGAALASTANAAVSSVNSSPPVSVAPVMDTAPSAVPGATDRSAGFDPTYYDDTAPYGGIEGANAWAGRQDFQSQFNAWSIDALKEIGGQFASPLGLDSAWGGLVDRGASELSRMSAPPSSQAGEYEQVVFNNTFVGMDPNKVSAELERQFQPGTAVAGRYRGN